MPKRATKVMLSEKEQEALTRISRRYRSEQQVALRACIVSSLSTGTVQCVHCPRVGDQCRHRPLVARSLGRIAGDRPGDAEHHGALTRRPTTRGAATDHGATTLSDRSVGL